MVKRKRNEALEEQYRLQGSCCLYCKENVPYELITRDHFLPVSKGNTLVNNKVFACRTCNNIKGNNSLEEFQKLLIKRSYNILKKCIDTDYLLSKKEMSILEHHSKTIKHLYSLIKINNISEILLT